MKSREFLRRLQQLGAEVDKSRGKGGHALVRLRGKRSTVPVHGAADLSPAFIKEICKQLVIDPNEVL